MTTTDRQLIRERLAHVSFDGVTGKIAFDANGDVPAKPVVIGTVRAGQLVTQGAEGGGQ